MEVMIKLNLGPLPMVFKIQFYCSLTHTSQALRDLTGEGVEVLDLRTTENKDELWPLLMHNTSESFLMGCAIEASGAVERLTNEGLLTNHAYSILDTKVY